ncbi:hypothetical protein DPSP01_006709 [Paraphaeosphaeria sporulosa]
MPSLSTIQSTISELNKGPPITVALPGGTTGIGSYIARALATTYANHGNKLRVYIIGRNATRAENVLSECRKTSPGSEWRFIQTPDLALISEVDRCCAEIVRQETQAPFHGGKARLDLLYMTYSYPVLKERSTTAEGLDSFLATVYYTRIRFILQLLPLLTASPLPAHAVSVYAGTFEDGTKPGQFPVGCPTDAAYGVGAVRKHASFMKTMIFEELAKKHAGNLRLTHIYPGLVDGPTFLGPDSPMWFKILWRFSKPLMSWYMTAPDVCGQVMVYLATAKYPAQGAISDGKDVARSSQGERGGGSYSVGQKADASKGIMYEKVRQADTKEKIWRHTMETLERAEKAGRLSK